MKKIILGIILSIAVMAISAVAMAKAALPARADGGSKISYSDEMNSIKAAITMRLDMQSLGEKNTKRYEVAKYCLDCIDGGGGGSGGEGGGGEGGGGEGGGGEGGGGEGGGGEGYSGEGGGDEGDISDDTSDEESDIESDNAYDVSGGVGPDEDGGVPPGEESDEQGFPGDPTLPTQSYQNCVASVSGNDSFGVGLAGFLCGGEPSQEQSTETGGTTETPPSPQPGETMGTCWTSANVGGNYTMSQSTTTKEGCFNTRLDFTITCGALQNKGWTYTDPETGEKKPVPISCASGFE